MRYTSGAEALTHRKKHISHDAKFPEDSFAFEINKFIQISLYWEHRPKRAEQNPRVGFWMTTGAPLISSKVSPRQPLPKTKRILIISQGQNRWPEDRQLCVYVLGNMCSNFHFSQWAEKGALISSWNRKTGKVPASLPGQVIVEQPDDEISFLVLFSLMFA